MIKGRRSHGSGTIIDKETNENIVVVAGGSDGIYNNDQGNQLDSTELLINGEWQQGTKSMHFFYDMKFNTLGQLIILESENNIFGT